MALVARDRSGAYADGVRQGAPDAVQVADRWHSIANFGESLEWAVLEQRAALPPHPAADPPAPAPRAAVGVARHEQLRRVRHTRREEHYQEVQRVH